MALTPTEQFQQDTIDGLTVNNGNMYPAKDHLKVLYSTNLLIALAAVSAEISIKQMLKYLLTRAETQQLIDAAFIEEITYYSTTAEIDAVIAEIKEVKRHLDAAQVGNLLEGVTPIVVSGGQDYSTALMHIYNPGSSPERRTGPIDQYPKFYRIVSALMLIGATETPNVVDFCVKMTFHSYTTETDIYKLGYDAIMQIYYPKATPPLMQLTGTVLACLTEAIQGTGCFVIPYANCEEGLG